MENQRILPHNHGDDHASLIENIPDLERIRSVADAMKQLGDPVRLQIFWILCHCEECVTNIAALVGMSSPAVSHHLRILKASGLVYSVRRGKETYYTASNTPLVDSLHHSMEEIIQITCPGA